MIFGIFDAAGAITVGPDYPLDDAILRARFKNVSFPENMGVATPDMVSFLAKLNVGIVPMAAAPATPKLHKAMLGSIPGPDADGTYTRTHVFVPLDEQDIETAEMTWNQEVNRRLVSTSEIVMSYLEKGAAVPAALLTYREAVRTLRANTAGEDVLSGDWPDPPTVPYAP